VLNQQHRQQQNKKMDPCERSRIIRQGRKLEEEHAAHVKKAALLLDAKSQWKNHLSKKETRNRDNVLAALQSEKVPESLGWSWNGFDRSCKDLRCDKEIMLQRLELPSFESEYKNSVYKVPAVFRNDKEVMIKIVSKSSRSLIHASAELKNDRDVVLAAIQNKQPCAPLAIEYASKKLKGDKKIVRVLLGHGHGIKALSLLPRSIQHDCNLVLQAIQWSSEECNESYETLSELAEEMLDDYDIVYEAAKRRGSNLQYVTDKSLLEDIDIVMAACENDGSAIQYVPKCPARDEMLEENNLIVLIENGGHCFLQELGEEYMVKRKYLLAAVKNGLIIPHDISLKLYEQNRSLFKSVLHHTNQPFEQYAAFPESIRDNSNVGTDILTTNTSFDEKSWAFRFCKDIPKDVMRNYIEPLMKMARDQCASGGGDFWDEKSIVISLCKIKGENFALVSTRLCEDVDVAKAAFSNENGSIYVQTIKKCPQSLFRANHDIAALAVKACEDTWSSYRVQSDILRHMGSQVISCKSFFLAWLRRGWPPRNYTGHTCSFRKDRDIALEAVKNAESGRDVRDLFTSFLPSRLSIDKEFMMKAVKANPLAFKEAGANLFEDFDYMLLGISKSKASLLSFYHHQENIFHRFSSFAATVREGISLADGFVSDFLGAMSIDSPGRKRPNKRRRAGQKSDNRCHLGMLGGDGSESIKRTIAEYCDIPIGSDLIMLRDAIENLEFWGY
jgi:hypothetical protein